MKTVAILTPTYNRCDTLNRLYSSLKRQTCNDFIWYIIDDGSSDDTQEKFDDIRCDSFTIVYKKKKNGGKHTAINYGLNFITEELVFIVDSDDWLEEQAIETICSDWKKYRGNSKIGGLSYYKLRQDGAVVGDSYNSKQEFVDSYSNVRVNKRVSGDKAEVWRTTVLRAYPFPEYPNEKFLSEAVVWNAISKNNYMLAFVPNGIYYCEYLDGGLSSSGRKLRLKCPYGTIDHCLSHLYNKIRINIQLKYLIYLTSESIYAGIKKYSFNKLGKWQYKLCYAILFIPCCLLALFWKVKYD